LAQILSYILKRIGYLSGDVLLHGYTLEPGRKPWFFLPGKREDDAFCLLVTYRQKNPPIFIGGSIKIFSVFYFFITSAIVLPISAGLATT
jgi:hypothetical protein